MGSGMGSGGIVSSIIGNLSNAPNTHNINLIKSNMANNININAESLTNVSDNSVGDNERDLNSITMSGGGPNSKLNSIVKEGGFWSEEEQVKFSKVPLHIMQLGILSKVIDGKYNNLVSKWVEKEGNYVNSSDEEREKEDLKDKIKEEDEEIGAVKKKKLEEILNHELKSGHDEINYSKIFNLLNS